MGYFFARSCKILIILACLFCQQTVFCAEKVIRIIDGDTVVLSRYKKVRLFGVDAPELNQRGGRDSAQKLKSIIGKQKVNCIPIGTSRSYGRRVCILVTESGTDINHHMVLSGQAYDSTLYSKGLYSVPMNKAKRKKRGVWKDKTRVYPWVWRRSKWYTRLRQ